MTRALLALAHAHRRLLPLYLTTLGPRAAYSLSRTAARLILRLLPPVRDRIARNVRLVGAAQLADMPEDTFVETAFVHQIWNLTDLLLAERLLHRGTFERLGGRIPDALRTRLLDAQRRRIPMIFVTAYYGPFDLLPLLLGLNGIQAAALYRPHANPWFDRQRKMIRARGGCELVPVHRAMHRLPEVLERGGAIAILADHHEPRRGVGVEFLGRPTRMSKAIGLLAMRYGADVIAAGIQRLAAPFRFRIVPLDVIRHDEWRGSSHDVAIEAITRRYVAALERLVRSDPTQYLWSRARWGASSSGGGGP